MSPDISIVLLSLLLGTGSSPQAAISDAANRRAKVERGREVEIIAFLDHCGDLRRRAGHYPV
jgi:hypothetical protein